MNYKDRVEPQRTESFQALSKRNGFFERTDGTVVCPYCYTMFGSTIKEEVLEEVLDALCLREKYDG